MSTHFHCLFTICSWGEQKKHRRRVCILLFIFIITKTPTTQHSIIMVESFLVVFRVVKSLTTVVFNETKRYCHFGLLQENATVSGVVIEVKNNMTTSLDKPQWLFLLMTRWYTPQRGITARFKDISISLIKQILWLYYRHSGRGCRNRCCSARDWNQA